MSTEQILMTARALPDAFNQHDFKIWDEAAADDLIADYPGAHAINKAQAYAYNKSFFDACDDVCFDVQEVIAQGNWVVFKMVTSATLTRPLVTPQQSFPATGKSIKIPFVLLVEVKDGKIVREQVMWDQLEVFMQWGLLPAA